jgi:prepilin-type N-terminal cleavage/methylation domain-containing protein
MIKSGNKILHRGFSLLEVSVVIFIMGIAITALLQMLDYGHLRYNDISTGWKKRVALTEIRVWLRNKVTISKINDINFENINEQIKLPGNFTLASISVSGYDTDTYFIKLHIFDDRNGDKKVNKSEASVKKLFCFRRRNT